MTKLLTRAYEETARLPRKRQDELARRILGDLDESVEGKRQAEPTAEPERLRRVPKKELQHHFDDLFASMGIRRREPIGAEALQERMRREADLEPNELSRGLIAAREE